MIQWIHVAVLGASLGCVSTLFMVFIWRWCHQRKDHHRNFVVEPKSFTRMETINQAGIDDDHKNNSSKFYVFHGSEKTRTLFSWEDHPYLAADAVENGWSRFNFMAHKSYNIIQSSRSRSTTSTLLGACAVVDDDDHGRGIEIEPEITFEVCQDSSEFMQKIRLNPGLKKKNSASMMIMRTSLPLPGPCLGNYAFPQEAYFEVTILCSSSSSSFDDDCKRSSEGEKTKLLVQDDGLNCKKGILDNVDEEMMRVECCKEGRNGKIGSLVMFSLGLSRGGGDVPLRVPGSYHGSIGFNSNGSVFLDGMKLVTESKKEEEEEWMIGSEKVIGCGFDPRQKQVFFTLNSELVHEIHCQSDEFSTPLYPTLASNIDIIVLINFGQSSFKYEPANAHRTPNPCFMGPIVNSHNAKLGYDDSKELFSMGRIDSQWHNGKSTPKGNIIPNHVAFDFDEESEADLFEIVLDDSGKSPNIVS
ncbi:hypothetical protein HN51_017598 [Arachis hypogaea]|uniref:SPRY domain-containing protein n=1 Tax=Arachis hypogaea TaxID=3818 RepID=A0A445CY06_ARAHY|nr:uncharacterized protein LOC107605648 [Arachis ipaensis]XP_025606931.1 uncharacterized protein LOC112697811 [Arachis hypogaea]XP_025660332.1 uncharacterized protein LOC112756109 [Arachis hypogaea]QHN88506.1 uncharacterized protein DS421_16g564060 [Arachis hypogaea]RYR55744.1 hypothetical protein Ahy_A06g030922 [Arachis hypogaea]